MVCLGAEKSWGKKAQKAKKKPTEAPVKMGDRPMCRPRGGRGANISKGVLGHNNRLAARTFSKRKRAGGGPGAVWGGEAPS